MKLNIFRYEGYVVVGILLTVFTFGKLMGLYDISSDWFWFLAGLGVAVEGVISLQKQKMFKKKFKVIRRV